MGCSSYQSPYLRDISRFPLLDSARERELGWLIVAGDASAWEELVRCNLRLAFRLAMDWPIRGYGRVDRADLVQAANFGLMRAARDFDPEQGTRFSTYARYWITNEIRRFCREKVLPIRVPHYLWDLLSAFHRAKSVCGSDPTAALESLGLCPLRRAKLVAAIAVLGEFRVAEPDRFGVNPWEPSVPADEVASVGEVDPADILPFLSILDEREYEVIASRFGLDGRPVEGPKSIAQRLGLNRESVRRIQAGAIRKVRGSLGMTP